MRTTGLNAEQIGTYVHQSTNGLVSAKWSSRPLLGLGCQEVARVEELEHLTGVPTLRCGTLWAMSDVLSINSNLYGAKRRQWCPRCYEEWDDDSYEPLVWSIDIVCSCPAHGCDLEHACPHCGAVQHETYRLHRRLCCRSCGRRLGQGAKRRRRPSFMRWMNSQCLELVEFCATPKDAPLRWSDYLDFVAGVCLSASSHGGLGPHMRGFLQGTDQRVRRQSQKPTVRTLLNLCALQSISMSELLSAPRESSSPLLFNQWAGLNYLPLPSASQARWIYVATRCIADFIGRRSPYMPPIGSFAKPFGVNLPALRDADQELCRSYEDRYQRQGSTSKLGSLYKAYLYCNRKMRRRPATKDAFTRASRQVAAATAIGIKDASMVVAGSFDVRDCLSDSCIGAYQEELTVREALEWLLAKWEASRVSHCDRC